MRTIQREIVGAFILSSDDKVALGRSRKGGSYDGELMIPGGGIEDGETPQEATRREILEEIGIDIAGQTMLDLGVVGNGESKKTLKSGETVMVEMSFHDTIVRFDQPASEIELVPDDDFSEAEWYDISTILERDDLAVPTQKMLERIVGGEFDI